MSSTQPSQYYDAVIVGAGAAGLSCALSVMREWEKNSNHVSVEHEPSVLVISKLAPLRSHTGSAEGGIAASLGSIEPDKWQWHYRDTVKGGDWLADQDAATILAQEAPSTVRRLEHDGVAFSRTAEGRIAQRRFGGHTTDSGKPVRRVAYAADHIGHHILHSLWQQCQKYSIEFADECYVTDLMLQSGNNLTQSSAPTVTGVVSLKESTGEIQAVRAGTVVLATGGAGRLYHTTSNSWDLTGDGMGLCLKAGLQLEDIEFVQFHPTGLGHTGILLSEACRGEGGILRNSDGEAFMNHYAPEAKDLAARDVVTRAITQEVAAGRGVKDSASPTSPADCVWLDLRPIGRSRLEEALPEVCATIKQFAGVDPATELVPVKPTAHYTMGGIPISLNGSVYVQSADGKRHPVKGLKAAGECSCVSVHGANRLGANSLLDAVVFGTRAGADIAKNLVTIGKRDGTQPADSPAAGTIVKQRTATVRDLLDPSEEEQSSDNPYKLMTDLGTVMESNLAVVRDESSINTTIQTLTNNLAPRAEKLRAHSNGRTFNQEVCAIMEVRNMVAVALAMARASKARKESRGSLFRTDYPTRNDHDFLIHSFIDESGNITTKPVVITDYPPERRHY